MQAIMRAFLQKMEIEADVAENGRTACEMAMQSVAEGRPYDVILMDIQMPKMNGEAGHKMASRTRLEGADHRGKHAQQRQGACGIPGRGLHPMPRKADHQGRVVRRRLAYVQC